MQQLPGHYISFGILATCFALLDRLVSVDSPVAATVVFQSQKSKGNPARICEPTNTARQKKTQAHICIPFAHKHAHAQIHACTRILHTHAHTHTHAGQVGTHTETHKPTTHSRTHSPTNRRARRHPHTHGNSKIDCKNTHRHRTQSISHDTRPPHPKHPQHRQACTQTRTEQCVDRSIYTCHERTSVEAVVACVCLPLQPSLAIIFILKGKPKNFAAWFGLKCSSFSAMNRGHSGRAPTSSTGFGERPAVAEGNCMLERIGNSQTFI